MSLFVHTVAFVGLCFFRPVFLDVGRLKSAKVLKELMREEGIIPDLIDENEAPQHSVTVMYERRSFSFGNKLQIIDIVEKPKTVNWPLEKGESYTLIMTGLDVPCRENPTAREYLHWLAVNIPERNFREANHLPVYNGAIHYYQRGLHRVVCLIYKQKKPTLEIEGEHHLEDFMKVKRENFSTRNFVKKYNLGPPFAINWAEIDDDCDVHSPPDHLDDFDE